MYYKLSHHSSWCNGTFRPSDPDTPSSPPPMTMTFARTCHTRSQVGPKKQQSYQYFVLSSNCTYHSSKEGEWGFYIEVQLCIGNDLIWEKKWPHPISSDRPATLELKHTLLNRHGTEIRVVLRVRSGVAWALMSPSRPQPHLLPPSLPLLYHFQPVWWSNELDD